MAEFKEPWEMLSDKKIWAMLGDPDHKISEDYVRLLFIELFSRVKNLEIENHAMKVILLETGLVSEETYEMVRRAVKDFFKEYDAQKEKEVEFYEKSGISFVDWVNFTLKGTFQAPG
ncbi:hypothetical protein Tfer_2790 [Thermincola ferriacetica]|uniref:Uncharacterized protein n=2 Tax=Thermincola TaxID=278993 RepID=D5XAF6_THEPJ|nr:MULTISPECIES: hypothetical protein [Thermincola]ADG81255.1 conserved hypothetical protein [Thermincola potens JR]KNZ68616.1 hypothetical protein Tfer_2790 [Thermincola ferriacetica]